MIIRKEKPDQPSKLRGLLQPYVREWFFSTFKEFSLPQLFGVMEIHSRKNVLVSAPTGSTKTLTGFLSIINELADNAEKGLLEDRVYCVYVSPLKALNYDIEVNLKGPLEGIEKLAKKKLGIRVGVRTGDTTPSEKARMLKKPPHILITTPESLAIILNSPKFSTMLTRVDWCIVDEIHALAENKRGVHLSVTLERLQAISGHMSRVGLSATVAPLDEVARFLSGNEDGKERDCTVIDVQFIKKMDLKVLSPAPDLINITHEEMEKRTYDLMHRLVQDHKTTLVFTNTRAGTERVVDNLKERYPRNYSEANVGAHHGSLSKQLRRTIEGRLRSGDLKVVVSSTSLELGIDIGYIDLVILLGSPKSVSRALQRVGRSGHRLHETTKGRIIVTDRDDLVECSVLLKSAVERKMDRIHIPRNALDVLVQHIYGIAINTRIHHKDVFNLLRRSYCYSDLPYHDFLKLLSYMAGEYASLESRRVYAKIWFDQDTGMIGRRGRMARVLYMTNIGTIPDEAHVTVKIGSDVIGEIDEGFLMRLSKGDIFVLGGQTYEFRYARGMTAQVKASVGRPPTVPSWFSEMLPLSFDLASEIGDFRYRMMTRLEAGRDSMTDFLLGHLYVDRTGAEAICNYFSEQHSFLEIPSSKNILIEEYLGDRRRLVVFHTLYGRRVNDCLSRAFAYAASRIHHFDIEIGITDNGFYLGSDKAINIEKTLEIVKASDLEELLRLAIEKTEVLLRRFRHCATRSLMILRSYMGRTKRVGRQQQSALLLLNAVKQIDPDFIILKEARREVLEDLMDVENANKVLDGIRSQAVGIKKVQTQIPSPFAFNIVIQGYADILRIEDKVAFLRRMHQNVLAKISLDKGKHQKGL